MNKPKRAAVREVTSPANSVVRIFRRSLAEGVTREGWVAVEGPHLIEEAIKAEPRATIQSVLFAHSAAERFNSMIQRIPHSAEVTVIPDPLFEQLSDTEAPQGIAALVEVARQGLDAIVTAPNPLVLAACGIQDPGNLGTMVRTAHALAATAFVTLQGTVSPFNPKAARASAGAIFHLPIETSLSADELVRKGRECGARLMAADQASPASIHDADLRGPLILFVGREGSGLDPEIARHVDSLVSIPIRAACDSLNAAIAASIFLYEAARQRGIA